MGADEYYVDDEIVLRRKIPLGFKKFKKLHTKMYIMALFRRLLKFRQTSIPVMCSTPTSYP